jgi:hypothetical protein
MHVSKAHPSAGCPGRERTYDALSYRITYIMLAAVANGTAWWLLATVFCSFVGSAAGSAVLAAVGLIAAGATFVFLLALSQRVLS